jgi:signal transduction histidine kinase
MDQVFSWIVTILGLAGFWLAGKKLWWSWYVNIANQVMWVIFALVTDYYAFLVGTAFYLAVFSRNAYLWTSEHFETKNKVLASNIDRLVTDYEQQRKAQPNYVNAFPCGHISNRWRLSCEMLDDHLGLHQAHDKTWTDAEGQFSDQFSGRVISPKE